MMSRNKIEAGNCPDLQFAKVFGAYDSEGKESFVQPRPSLSSPAALAHIHLLVRAQLTLGQQTRQPIRPTLTETQG
ncbi:hypothetical protein UPYG_G00014040 [Umbra pygmaea]|uniref:Uncharacterized protein n=1 Tax=Umbra pygmaea TaxID=75934 RepID=A0ABD0XJ95_UMBPY